MLLKLLALATFTGIALAPTDLPDLAIGTSAPSADVKLKDVIGSERSLKDIAAENGLLVIFSCNTCPFVIGSEGSEGWQDRYGALAQGCAAKKIGFTLVNSNDAKRDEGDSYNDMQLQYKKHNYGGHYLLDQGHVLADAFGARTTRVETCCHGSSGASASIPARRAGGGRRQSMKRLDTDSSLDTRVIVSARSCAQES